MSNLTACAAASCAALLAGTGVALAGPVAGTYLETRSTDVYTGPCFANGQVGLTGGEAILAWRIEEGTREGIDLSGLSVVGVVKASDTLGDPYGEPLPSRAVMIVDEKATAEQRTALVAFAREMAGELLDDVVLTEALPIRLEVQETGGHPGRAILEAGFAVVETRGLSTEDHVCGNESTYYPPLAPTTHAMPAVALTDSYTGPGLGISWTAHERRSAFVGRFELP